MDEKPQRRVDGSSEYRKTNPLGKSLNLPRRGLAMGNGKMRGIHTRREHTLSTGRVDDGRR
ncbi:MAG: hypothetical protein WC914_10880 [Proteiniphilum sp.]